MTTIKISSNRRVTLPKKLCDEMRVRPGDSLVVERQLIGKENVWVFHPVPRGSLSKLAWVGSLKRYAVGKSHDMASIRRTFLEKPYY